MTDKITNASDYEEASQEHFRFCSRVEDAAIALQDSAYALGLARGRAESAQEIAALRARLAQHDDEAIVADSAIAAWNAVGDLMDGGAA